MRYNSIIKSEGEIKMTEKQRNFIENLLETRDYNTNSDIQAFNAGVNLSSESASNIINYLLKCESTSHLVTRQQRAYINVLKTKREFDAQKVFSVETKDEATAIIEYLLTCPLKEKARKQSKKNLEEAKKKLATLNKTLSKQGTSFTLRKLIRECEATILREQEALAI